MPDTIPARTHTPGPMRTWQRFRVYIEPRDAWVGVYNAQSAVYICPLPFVVIKYRKWRPSDG